MANKKIKDVASVLVIEGSFKIPCSVGDNEAHTITVSDLVSFAIQNIDYVNIKNTPKLSKVALSGSWNDILDKPTIPTKTSQLSNDSDYVNKRDVENTFKPKLRIEDIPEITSTFTAKPNRFYRVSQIQTQNINFVDCNCSDVGYLEIAIGDVMPRFTFPKGVFVSGMIDEKRKLYQLRFLSNTVIINKFEQI